MRNIVKIFSTFIFLFLLTNEATAGRKKLHRGIERVCIVTELPDTKEYLVNKKSQNYLDLAIKYEELIIANIPVWTIGKAKNVMMDKNNKCYEITEIELQKKLKFNSLEKKDLLQLNWYVRYGGKLLLFLFIAIVIYIIVSKEKLRHRFRIRNLFKRG